MKNADGEFAWWKCVRFAWLGGLGVKRLPSARPSSPHPHPLQPLYLTRHRLYSATLNRFLATDPAGLSGGLNLYAYCEGDPLAYVDPPGLCATSDGGLMGGLLNLIGGAVTVLDETMFGAGALVGNITMSMVMFSCCSTYGARYFIGCWR